MQCPECGSAQDPDMRFCNQCGHSFTSEVKAEQVSQLQSSTYAERRQVSILFSDIVDSTSLSEKIDIEDLQILLHKYQVSCNRVISFYGGYLAKFLGDGILAYFGYPNAHGDDAQKAIQAGLGIVEGLKALNQELENELGLAIEVRVGIHTGMVVVGDMSSSFTLESNSIVGHATNLASRIQSIANPNEVVVSEATYNLTRGFFETKDYGKHNLRGVSKPIQIHRIIHENSERNRLDAYFENLTPFMGREEEQDTIKDLWLDSTSGHINTVHVIGEGGIGKSRLLLSIKDHVSMTPGAWITEIYCSSNHRNSSFYPVIQVLEKMIFKNDSLENDEVLTRIEGFVSMYGIPIEENVPLIADLLSIPNADRYGHLELTPQRKKSKTIELLTSILMRRADIQPVLFVAEDLHWADPSTFELLESLVSQKEDHAILIVLAYRPELNYQWSNTDKAKILRLEGLSRAEAEQIIRRVSNDIKIPEELIDFIISKSEGFPLYIEEITKGILESDILIKKEEYILSDKIEALQIPSSLHDLLIAKLDRIPEARNIAQLASIIGREFSFDLLLMLTGMEESNLSNLLNKLIDSEILVLNTNLESEERTYLFRHALIQDSAYSSLLKSTRKDFHILIAETLEKRSDGILEKQPEILAWHYKKGYDSLRSIQYWIKAGLLATQKSANIEAISHFREGLKLIQFVSDPMQKSGLELQLLSAMGPGLIATRGFADKEVGEVYLRAKEISEKIGIGPQIFIPIWGQWVYNLVRGNLDESENLAREMKRMGEETKDSSMLVEAFWTLGDTLYWQGEFNAALKNLDGAIDIYDPKKHHLQAHIYGQDPGVAAHCYKTYCLWQIGKPEQAQKEVEKAEALAVKLRHPFSIGWAKAFSFSLSMYNEDYESNIVKSMDAISYCQEQAYPFWLFAAMCNLGWSTALTGEAEKGLQILEEGLQGWDMIGSILVKPSYMNLHAEALILNDQVDKAIEVASQSILLAKQIQEVVTEVDSHRILAKCLRFASRLSEAEEAARFSLAYARKQGAVSNELKSAVELHDILKAKGKEKEGRGIVKTSLDKFNEGVELPFVQRANHIINT